MFRNPFFPRRRAAVGFVSSALLAMAVVLPTIALAQSLPQIIRHAPVTTESNVALDVSFPASTVLEANVLVDGQKTDKRLPLIATSPYGEGRVMVVGGTGIAAMANDAFLTDALYWLNGNHPVYCKEGLFVVGDSQAFEKPADKWVAAIKIQTLAKRLKDNTIGAKLIYLTSAELKNHRNLIPLLKKFVYEGGGLLFSGTDCEEANQLFKTMGIQFTKSALKLPAIEIPLRAVGESC